MPNASPAGAGERRLLVVHPGALGDLVQAMPAMARLRDHAGPATLLVGASHAAFMRGTGLFDHVLAFDDATAYHGAARARLRVLAAAARRARGARPDVCAVFKASPVYAALAALSGARRRVGLTRGHVGAQLLTDPVWVTRFGHWEDRYAAVAASGVAALTRVATARVATAGVAPPRSLDLSPAGLPSRDAAGLGWPALEPSEPAVARGPVIAVAPGGARNAKADLPQKRWPAARFAAVARQLAARHPSATFVLLGAPGDRADADACLALCPALPVRDLVGHTSVAEARAAIAGCTLFLGNDSALLHVAATTGTPAVAVFGPTDPRAICPRAPTVTPVWQPARDRPCFDDVTGAVAPCRVPCCMDRVDVARVVGAAEAALARVQSLVGSASGARVPSR